MNQFFGFYLRGDFDTRKSRGAALVVGQDNVLDPRRTTLDVPVRSIPQRLTCIVDPELVAPPAIEQCQSFTKRGQRGGIDDGGVRHDILVEAGQDIGFADDAFGGFGAAASSGGPETIAEPAGKGHDSGRPPTAAGVCRAQNHPFMYRRAAPPQ